MRERTEKLSLSEKSKPTLPPRTVMKGSLHAARDKIGKMKKEEEVTVAQDCRNENTVDGGGCGGMKPQQPAVGVN